MKVADDIVKILERAIYAGCSVRIGEQLERKLYTQVNKVLEAAGGKWSRKDQAHIFPDTAYDLLDPVFTLGEIEAPKDDFDFFPTPEKLAHKLYSKFNDFCGCPVGTSFLEPSAGNGDLIFPFYHYADRPMLNTTWTILDIRDEKSKLSTRFPKAEIICQNFLEFSPGRKFDRIIMNPPFSKQRDIDHVLHALKLLSPEGNLMAIMSSSIMFRSNAKAVEFRSILEGYEASIEYLPEGSFKESGTGVNVVLVIV